MRPLNEPLLYDFMYMRMPPGRFFTNKPRADGFSGRKLLRFSKPAEHFLFRRVVERDKSFGRINAQRRSLKVNVRRRPLTVNVRRRALKVNVRRRAFEVNVRRRALKEQTHLAQKKNWKNHDDDFLSHNTRDIDFFYHKRFISILIREQKHLHYEHRQ